MSQRLIELVESFGHPTVVLLGDLMLDRYLYGDAQRISPEAPVLVLRHEREEHRLGGAGNVAACLATLGARVRVVGLVGVDDAGRDIRQRLEVAGCDAGGVIAAAGRRTTVKTRLVGSSQHKNPQQLMRLDLEDTAPIDAELEQAVVDRCQRAMDGARMLAIEDYNKGLLSDPLCRRVIALARAGGLSILIDPANIPDYSRYRGATCLKMNRPEAERATGLPLRQPGDFAPGAARLLEALEAEAVIITLDRQGSILASAADGQRPAEHRLLSTRQRQVADGTGAGDMVLAMLVMARAAGGTWSESATLANIAGGLEVERFGVVPITRDEVIAELFAETHQQLGKQRTLEQLLPELVRHRAAGRKVVFTNGCFDLVHLGHVKYFQFAKRQGDLLIVAVNTDQSIRRLKGEKRPIITQEDRLGVLEELESIDYLLSFDDDTPLEIIRQIRPDVLVKGADYAKQQVVGWDLVESSGGRVALAPLVDGRSTSTMIQRIVEAYG